MKTTTHGIAIPVLLGFLCAANVCAGEGPAANKAAALKTPPELSLIDASIIWHRIKGIEIVPAEFNILHEKELYSNNEFEKAKNQDLALKNHKRTEDSLLKVSTFSLSVSIELGEYDFDKLFFPTDLKAAPLGIVVGSFSTGDKEVITTLTQNKDNFLYVNYLESFDIPEELTTLAVDKEKGEKILELVPDRKIALVLYGVLTGKTEESDSVDQTMLGTIKRKIPMNLTHAELRLPDTVQTKHNKAVIVPGEVLKVWDAPAAGRH